MTELTDSPSDWVADHIHRYVETGGEDGHLWRGVPTLLLTTTGRKTGTLRRTALIYGRHEGSYLIVASQGGAPTHPSWYLNLQANPQVSLQVGPEQLDATASTAQPGDYDQLWQIMNQIWPAYQEYQAKTSRQIPVVVLTPSQ